MSYTFMDPEKIRQILSSEQDVITPAVTQESQLYETAQCPVCSHVGAKKVVRAPKLAITKDGISVIQTPFSSGSPLIQGHAQCLTCHTEYSPRTGVIIKADEPVLTHPGLDLGDD